MPTKIKYYKVKLDRDRFDIAKCVQEVVDGNVIETFQMFGSDDFHDRQEMIIIKEIKL